MNRGFERSETAREGVMLISGKTLVRKDQHGVAIERCLDLALVLIG